jgi:hypothetical protein
MCRHCGRKPNPQGHMPQGYMCVALKHGLRKMILLQPNTKGECQGRKMMMLMFIISLL